jgi:hypothetical protein
MKFVLGLLIAAVAIAYFGHRASTAIQADSKKSGTRITDVSNLLNRAATGKPLDGRQAPDGRWIARMTAACKRRETLLAQVPRAGSASAIAARGERILAIYDAFSARVASIRPPAGYKTEARRIRSFNARQERLLEREVRAAGSGDLGLATRESVALRELAGRANAVFLALHLDRCAFGSSSMPL